MGFFGLDLKDFIIRGGFYYGSMGCGDVVERDGEV